MSTKADRQAALERQERDRREYNDDVRDRQYCLVCSTSVRERNYDYKYMAAGGILAGPFCSRGCYYGFLLEDGGSDAE